MFDERAVTRRAALARGRPLAERAAIVSQRWRGAMPSPRRGPPFRRACSLQPARRMPHKIELRRPNDSGGRALAVPFVPTTRAASCARLVVPSLLRRRTSHSPNPGSTCGSGSIPTLDRTAPDSQRPSISVSFRRLRQADSTTRHSQATRPPALPRSLPNLPATLLCRSLVLRRPRPSAALRCPRPSAGRARCLSCARAARGASLGCT